MGEVDASVAPLVDHRDTFVKAPPVLASSCVMGNELPKPPKLTKSKTCPVRLSNRPYVKLLVIRKVQLCSGHPICFKSLGKKPFEDTMPLLNWTNCPVDSDQ